MLQSASNLNVESTLAWNKQLTNRPNNEPNNTSQKLSGNQIMKKPRILHAGVETFLTISWLLQFRGCKILDMYSQFQQWSRGSTLFVIKFYFTILQCTPKCLCTIHWPTQRFSHPVYAKMCIDSVLCQVSCCCIPHLELISLSLVSCKTNMQFNKLVLYCGQAWLAMAATLT